MFKDEKINYTNYLRDKPQEADSEKVVAMEKRTAEELADRGIYYGLEFTCYADGRVKVDINGEFYGVFDSVAGKFFAGAPGD